LVVDEQGTPADKRSKRMVLPVASSTGEILQLTTTCFQDGVRVAVRQLQAATYMLMPGVAVEMAITYSRGRRSNIPTRLNEHICPPSRERAKKIAKQLVKVAQQVPLRLISYMNITMPMPVT
jgi:hypothetical protein